MKKITEKARKLLKHKATVSPVSRDDIKVRNTNIGVLYAQGMSLTDIGKLYNISKQRVSQILYSVGISKQEDTVENNKDKLIEKLSESLEVWKGRARRNRELYAKERLTVLNLNSTLKRRDRKIEKLEKEVGRLTLLMGVENVNIKK